jgi:hypothetical protein
MAFLRTTKKEKSIENFGPKKNKTITIEREPYPTKTARPGWKKGLLILFMLLIVFGSGATAYYFYHKYKLLYQK